MWVPPGGGPVGRIDTGASAWRGEGSVVVVDSAASLVDIRSTKPAAELPAIALNGLWVRGAGEAPLPLAGVPLHDVAADAPDPTGVAMELAVRWRRWMLGR